ncbi:radical SAM/SPASM domain-containing protein [Acanthopleuribacter pedis]|uniref:Radical SAM protein n=1 Tax=Acanthopleuribacter pedis TaxID=442870 RepID=A0A8J7Q3N6_9BACT|nr:radical SAM protein [Acanthopleuribacter pedis]MBO1317368.1 radical SAM protein [Acanthopleuribacter pedis]MBO1318675.1 radical SAM protein [Acanthopleuribacter pedis]
MVFTDPVANPAAEADTSGSYQRTTYAVWEITLKCNLACAHCGSRAGDSRVDELSTAEAFDLIHQMADLGIKEVSLIGGEAFLRKDWLDLATEITRVGMRPTMTTGGFGISERTAERMAEAGIRGVSVSVDGLEAVHDKLRGRKGSWKQVFQTLAHFRKVGIPFGCNTQINRLSAPQFPLLYQTLLDAGVSFWQIQLTVPMGNAVESNQILMQPWELVDLYPMLAWLSKTGHAEGLQIQPGNNIGYFGPYERAMRGVRFKDNQNVFYTGCNAGLQVIGIEADGSIKGCPSLPTNAYTGGNIREKKLEDIFYNAEELKFNENAGTPEGTDHLWGGCKGCEFAELCRGGCNWTAHVFFGKRGNNPYCHHRALKQVANGQRERFSLKTGAAGLPFDHGIFDMVTEPFNAPYDDPLAFSLDKVQFPERLVASYEGNLLAGLKEHRDKYLKYYAERFPLAQPV